MSKEGLLISILKSGQSIAELHKSKSNSIGVEEIKNKFNMLQNNLSKKEIEQIRENFYRNEKADHRLKELEKEKFNRTRGNRKKTLH